MINVGFDLTGPDIDPDAVSLGLAVNPHSCARKGDVYRRGPDGRVISQHPDGWWHLDSTPLIRVSGDARMDINEHLKVLLDVLLPKREIILEFATGGETYFGVIWKSTYLYAGTGPLIEAQYLRGITELGAGIGFDIYQVDEEEDNANQAMHPRPVAGK